MTLPTSADNQNKMEHFDQYITWPRSPCRCCCIFDRVWFKESLRNGYAGKGMGNAEGVSWLYHMAVVMCRVMRLWLGTLTS